MRVVDSLSLFDRAADFFRGLQGDICDALGGVDGGRFGADAWTRAEGGGGVARVLEGGAVFEKAGVNWSLVEGELSAEFAGQLPGEGRTFRATGVSLVLHPRSPRVPTTHANFRCLEKGGKVWFGGGADLTPYVLERDDAMHFHRAFADACDRHRPIGDYDRFKRWCDEYFFLPHRGEPRGVGGIFFDYLGAPEHDPEAVFAFAKANLAEGNLNTAKYALGSTFDATLVGAHAKALTNNHVAAFAQDLDTLVLFNPGQLSEHTILTEVPVNKKIPFLELINILDANRANFVLNREALQNVYVRRGLKRVQGTRDENGKLVEPTLKTEFVNDDAFYVNLNRAVLQTEKLLTDILSGEGTAGRIISDPTLYNQLTDTVTQLRRVVDGVNEQILAGRGTIGRLLKDEELYNRANSLVGKLDETSARIERTMAKIERGEGNLGKLLNDEKLYQDMRTTVENFSIA
jgi:hypothetical protein